MITNTTHLPIGEASNVGLATELDHSTTLDEIRRGLIRKYQIYLPVDHIIDFSHMGEGSTQAGDFEYIGTQQDGLHPEAVRNRNGLTLTFNRPANAVDPDHYSYFAGLDPSRVGMLPGHFALFATFRRPIQEPWKVGPAHEINPLFRDGEWAAGLLVQVPGGRPQGMGVTCQFRPDGTRMNLPGTGVLNDTNRRPFLATFAPDAESSLLDPVNPSNFTLVLSYDRSSMTNTGFAALYIGADLIDSYSFNFDMMTNAGSITRALAGLGSISGAAYKAQIDLVDLQIWGLPT